ncbi:MAG TPA: hypothetical protein VLM79_13110, partial [Kofleriaceae bacterium]|nr:hypothetical protein [Kofleriaceae bacterium]
MHDEPDVALVDAHAERVRRDDHVELVRHEHVLGLLADPVLEPGVIDARPHAGLLERLRVRLGILAGRGVDQRDAALARAHQVDQLLGLVRRAARRDDRVVQVRPIEAADVERRAGDPELDRDVLADLRGRRRREGGDPRRLELADDLT